MRRQNETENLLIEKKVKENRKKQELRQKQYDQKS